MIEASCHCGAVSLKIKSDLPDSLTSCNCSICSRYGSLMAYFSESHVEVIAEADAIQKYIWGDKQMAFVHCKVCGCFSHWEGLPPKESDRMGVNTRLFVNPKIGGIPIKRFDGAKTWKFLD